MYLRGQPPLAEAVSFQLHTCVKCTTVSCFFLECVTVGQRGWGLWTYVWQDSGVKLLVCGPGRRWVATVRESPVHFIRATFNPESFLHPFHPCPAIREDSKQHRGVMATLLLLLLLLLVLKLHWRAMSHRKPLSSIELSSLFPTFIFYYSFIYCGMLWL